MLKGDENIGTITSGSWSPTKQQAIAFAYINTSHALINNEVQIFSSPLRTAQPFLPIALPSIERPTNFF